MPKYTVECEYVDHCLHSYLTNLTEIVIGVSGTGQTVDQMANDILAELGSADYGMPEEITDEDIRAAVHAALLKEARFWPVDEHGNEINTDEHPEFLERDSDDDEEPCYWFRFTVTEVK